MPLPRASPSPHRNLHTTPHPPPPSRGAPQALHNSSPHSIPSPRHRRHRPPSPPRPLPLARPISSSFRYLPLSGNILHSGRRHLRPERAGPHAKRRERACVDRVRRHVEARA
ncbi:hypothetical protein Ahy_A06g026782 isoform B [Arachis hypogaea]|uniref:Uncharacterized protein n=1 Tax=Arachis hypogaea TaxID=3818 RepID=A0A445CLI5_ARAHY|nr:hypothetical protein Ahy_A06g026782 isoform B [Arachis hypogaea]